MTFSLALDPFNQLARRLQSDDLPGAALANAGEELRTLIDLGFEAEADPWGTPWEPLSNRTLKARRGDDAAILNDTGQLRASISVGQPSGDGLEVGAYDTPYAATHQFGRDAIPARPFLPIRDGEVDLPDDWQEDITAAFVDALEAELS